MEITPNKWQRAKAVFDAALQRPPEERASFLALACPEDDIRQQVEQLLLNHEQAGSFLSKPAIEVPKTERFVAGSIVAGHFKIVRLLGKGGMGEVFEAEDLKMFGRQVALKFLPQELAHDRQMRERFEREAKAASALDHPNICTVYEIGEHEGHPFMAMQYLDGQTLQERIQGKLLKIATVLDLGIQIADALDAAHSKSIIHRDVKPANIFVTTREQAKILDFGLAKQQLVHRARAVEAVDGSTVSLPQESLTSPGAALGTIAYMSPEQVRGEDLDARTDLFSFGAVLYEMATGQHAFSGRTTGVIHDAILNREPTSARQSNPHVPLELERIIAKALEKDREVRYQHAADVRADLKRLKRESESGRLSTIAAPSIGRATRSFPLRFGPWTLVFLGILVIASAFLAFRTWSKRQELFHVEIKQRRLTANPGDNPVDWPLISSDAKYLAYSDKGGIRIKLLETGELQTIPPPTNFKPGRDAWTPAAWFPDSTRILVNGTQSGTSSIWIVSILRGTARLLRESSRAWSVAPNGSLIVFTTGTLSTLWKVESEIWLMGPDGDNARRFLVADQDSGFTRVMWQPNGQGIAYLKITGGDNSIETRDLQSRLGTVIWADPNLQDFCFLRDGRVIFSRVRGYYEATDADLWGIKLDLSTGKPRARPVQLISWPSSNLQLLSATADGSHLVFLKSSYQTQVYVGELEGGGSRLKLPPRVLTHGEAIHRPTAWTPDSKAVLFSSDLNGSWDIYKQALDKNEPELLISGPEFKIDPRLSPDDKWILYTTAAISDPYQIAATTPVFIKRVPVSGGAPQLIASARGQINPFRCGRSPGECVWAEVSADRKQVIFYSFDPITGRGRQLAISQDIQAENFDVSPDGSKVAWNAFDPVAGLIRLLSFENGKTSELKIEGWNALSSLDWAMDGKGLFVSSVTLRDSTLLYVDLQGRANALWHQDYPETWGAPSPDGHHLAMLGGTQDRNVWMLENF